MANLPKTADGSLYYYGQSSFISASGAWPDFGAQSVNVQQLAQTLSAQQMAELSARFYGTGKGAALTQQIEQREALSTGRAICLSGKLQRVE